MLIKPLYLTFIEPLSGYYIISQLNLFLTVPAGGINEVGLQQESSCLGSTADGVKTEADELAIKDITTSLKASQLEMPVETKVLYFY